MVNVIPKGNQNPLTISKGNGRNIEGSISSLK